ncbi:TerD family protein [Ectobacillus panaciterrae]|uniref:TerD family protein n=1 Tax=Ectobacillus panaciterrae TaxID=363872 RepID=UPI0004295A0E|nr:TerD family protein [Ectobacillus panaciterrae]
MIALVKGQKVDLTKQSPSLTTIKVGLGWDVNPSLSHDFDLDASALLLDTTGRIVSQRNLVYYNNLTASQGGVILSKDNRTGVGEGDDEEIMIHLSKIPPQIERIVLAVTIHEATKRQQTFGQINRAFVRISNKITKQEICRYELGKEFSVETAVVLGEIYRYKGEWKFGAVGRGLEGGLIALAESYGLSHLPPMFFEKKAPQQPVLDSNNSASINLSKIELKKSGDAINLNKTSKPLGEIAVNLNWNQQSNQQSGGFFATVFGTSQRGVDLDLGCLFEFKAGRKGVVQALGNTFGSYESIPYIHLDQDDRTGASQNGENLRINGNKVRDLKRILIFAYIYEGAANWSQVDGVVTIKQQNGPDIVVKMDEHRNGLGMCAIAMLENVSDETFKVRKLVQYFSGHKEMDRAFGWNMNWVEGSK